MTSSYFVNYMLVKYGVYLRSCSDKIGLQGEFIRVACRNKEENEIILKSFAKVLD